MWKAILTGIGIAASVFLLVLGYGLLFPVLNGDRRHPPRFFHEDYTGEELAYPATWKEDKGEFGFAGYKGARNCGFYVYSDSADLRQDRIAREAVNPLSVFGDRPKWAGPLQPVASYAVTTDAGKGIRITEYRTSFKTSDNAEEVDEYMQVGDEGCRTDLEMIERSFRIFKPDRSRLP